MNLIPFSKRFNNEFLSRQEDNFERLIEKLHTFRGKMQGKRRGARRLLPTRFNYAEELKDVRINQNGLSTEEVSAEFQEMLEGCVRQHDPMAAFNIFPSPLLDAVAGSALMSLYTPNALWDLLSGKMCLFEKKIVRMIGQLAGWSKADGYVVSGGKQALMYAIKIGIERARKNRDVPMTDFVVLTSGTSHFCIEHICHYFGLGAKNCLRIKTLSNGEIDLVHFQETMDRAVSQGKKIAAVIAVGGATIN